jgi:group I intron endonuclease
MKKITGIYKITSPTGRVYIGQSINIIRRWNEYKKLHGCGSKTRLYRSLKKYGHNKHKFEILCQCENRELNDKEIYYIDLYQCFNSESGMNLHSGGNNHTISDETREKLKISHLGQKAWNKGIPRTDEEKLAHSIKMKGRTASKETKLKMGIARRGKKHTDETKKILSEAKMGNKVWLGRHHTEESKLKMRKPKIKKHVI